MFINYDEHEKKCFTTTTCNQPTPRTKVPWRPYTCEAPGTPPPAPESEDGLQPPVQTMSQPNLRRTLQPVSQPGSESEGEWKPFVDKHTKCERPAGEHPFTVP